MRTPVRTYKVNSLQRGLAILRVVRAGHGPMRNQDVVAHTGLPKATVSRLMHTLTAMGYLRRIDQGSYVLGEASARSGRAMLDGLGLQRYAPCFHELLRESGAFACLEARISNSMVPVFRWSAEGATLLASGLGSEMGSIDTLAHVCFDFFFGDAATVFDPDSAKGVTLQQLSSVNWCHQWDESMGQLLICTGVRHKSVGCFVLSLRMPQPDLPSADRIARVGYRLLSVARVISNDAIELNGGEHDDTSA